ncbi:MAG: hypothetical protein ACJ75Z_10875 [Solirubrobacterales bacterium]
MLFDLQSPGRRRVVRVVFGGLALVFAISFVFLGVGTGGGGFSFSDLFGGGGGSSASSAFDDQIEAAQKQLAVNPNDTAALAKLVQLHYSAGSQDVDSNGALTSDGEQQLREGADSWNKYVQVTKGNIDQTAALFALNTFDQLASVDFQKARTDSTATDAVTDVNSAVDEWKSAAQAQQVLIEKQPGKNVSNSYARLASYLYLAGDTQAADQAAARAKQSAKGSDASSIDTQLKPIKQLGQQLQTAITQLAKQQQQTQGAAGGGNPLGGVGGGLGGAGTGGALSAP